MSSSSSGSRDPIRSTPASGARGSSAASSEAERAQHELLETVLRQTLVAARTEDALDATDMADLLDVARKHRGKPLVLDPVALELVQAVLRRPFQSLVDSPQTWQAMTWHIATALFEDPTARSRLESLWTGICERSS